MNIILKFINEIFDAEINHTKDIIQNLEDDDRPVPKEILDEQAKAEIVKEYINQKLIVNPNSQLRLGQKLENYMEQKTSRDNIHQRLFHMSDKEFMEILNADASYVY